MSLPVTHVPFRKNLIEAVKDDKGVWLTLFGLCRLIGIDYTTQYRRLTDPKRRPPWALVATLPVMLADGTSYSTLCLHLDALHTWLTDVNTAKNHHEVKATIVVCLNEATLTIREYLAKQPNTAEPETPAGQPEPAIQVEDSVAEEVLEQPQQPSPAGQIQDLAIGQIQQMCLEQQWRIDQLDRRIRQLDRRIRQLDQLVTCGQHRNGDGLPTQNHVPPTSVPAPVEDRRTQIREMVQNYVDITGCERKKVWGELYRRFIKRYRIDVFAMRDRNRDSGCDGNRAKIIAEVEQLGMLDQLYTLAQEVLAYKSGDPTIVPVTRRPGMRFS